MIFGLLCPGLVLKNPSFCRIFQQGHHFASWVSNPLRGWYSACSADDTFLRQSF